MIIEIIRHAVSTLWTSKGQICEWGLTLNQFDALWEMTQEARLDKRSEKWSAQSQECFGVSIVPLVLSGSEGELNPSAPLGRLATAVQSIKEGREWFGFPSESELLPAYPSPSETFSHFQLNSLQTCLQGECDNVEGQRNTIALYRHLPLTFT